jgi:hypothetical protein
MPNSITPSGYTPTFHMPIIDSSQNFAAIKAANIITASQVDHYALKITVTNATHRKLFSMAGGVVYFAPQNVSPDPFLLYDIYPNLPPLLPGTGFLVQMIWPADFKKLNSVLPIGVPPPMQIVYLNVAPSTVRPALKPFVQKLPDKWLTDAPVAGNHEQYVEGFLDKFLLGKAGVFVEGGTYIGDMAMADFTLFFAGTDLNGLSPILHVRDMPDYGGVQWHSHPLIEIVSALPVPVDIYAEFNLWDNSEKVFKPLPSGVTIDLTDYDPDPSNADLDSKTTDENSYGKVQFHFSNIQNIDEIKPDLFFRVHLGNHNPDPNLLVDPWTSREWVFSTLLGFYNTGSGYFEDFDGTRLGSETLPLLFRIGLGFWADLISFRPSVSIQQQLKASNPSAEVQFIEDAGDSEFPEEPGLTPDVNLDYYPVSVKTFPTVGGQLLTPMDLLRHVRLNINTLVDTSLFEFDLKNVPPEWASANPAVLQELQQLLGLVVKIDFYQWSINAEDGSVVLSSIDTTQFTFSTIYTGILDDSFHPVSGNRQIGFTPQQDGSYIFYTRGADRPTTTQDDFFSALEFHGADVSWKSLQQGIADFVNANGGVASVQPSVSARFPWNDVKAKYWNPTTGRI